jgi:cation:H+ antiporter
LSFSSEELVKSVSNLCKFLGWKEFVVAFFFIAFSVSLPNFTVGIFSALNKVPELSLGDVVGGNIFDLSLCLGIAVLFSRSGILASSRTIQGSALYLFFLIFIFFVFLSDGDLSRLDGFFLLIIFFFYVFWLFQKDDRFKKIYGEIEEKKEISFFLKNFFFFLFYSFLMISASYGVVISAKFLAEFFKLSIGLIGLFIVAIGNSLPETFFSFQAAKSNQNWLILGNLIGGVIVTMTLVLGIVVLISPIKIQNYTPFFLARFFLLLISIFFLIFLRSHEKISKKEGVFLVLLYIFYLLLAIFQINR